MNYKENNLVNAFFLIIWADFLWRNTVLMQAVDSNVASEPSIEDLSTHTAHSAQATNDATQSKSLARLVTSYHYTLRSQAPGCSSLAPH